MTTAGCFVRGSLLAYYTAAESEPSGFPHESYLFPGSRQRIEGLPPRVRRSLDDARSCHERGLYALSIIMARKTVEALCNDLGIKKGNLNQRLKTLQKNGRIEHRLYQWAQEVRLIGNKAVHDLEINPTAKDAADIIEFVEAILLYTYVLDRRYRTFQGRQN